MGETEKIIQRPKLTKTQLAAMLFKRIRPTLSMAGFALFSVAVLGIANAESILFVLSIAMLCIASDLYNDYTDYEEDVRNKRFEKLTTSGLITLDETMLISMALVFFGLSILITTPFLFVYAVVCGAIMFSYSHPKIRLKKYNILGYAVGCLVFLSYPFVLGNYFQAKPDYGLIVPLALYNFFQMNYILSQKDATDTKDTTNLFLANGKAKAVLICLLMAALSCVSTFMISTIKPQLFLMLAISVILKILNISVIWFKPDRKIRSNIVLFEHLSPGIFALLVMLWMQ